MLLYRISAPQYAGDISGNGARLYGGRWNDKGVAVVYFALSRAMAMLELLVHLRPEDLQRPYTISVMDVPDDKIMKISIEKLPKDWRSETRKPYLHQLTMEFITAGEYLMMEVPSVLIEEENNYILNPLHADLDLVKVISSRQFSFDYRFKR